MFAASMVTATAMATDAEENARDPLSLIGARATKGAAAGYIEDRHCGTCHVSHYEGFQSVGMAQAFKRPAEARPVETFGETYFHEASQRYYEIRQGDDGALTFRRYQRDGDGGIVHLIEIPVDWVLGSGNRARSYLYQTDWGEMFLLPISWYSEAGRWRMSPGFEHAGHQGIHRRINRACVFCHNALPEVDDDADVEWAPQVFPQELPGGIGCQRCHGPGADHVRGLLTGGDAEEARDSIINPARLPPERRDSVCFQCHLLPSEAVEGPRRIDRDDFSFRPGQLLSDYLVHIDIAEEGVRSGERFEINHHGYRLTQSACYRESEGALTCISCHDPHVKPESGAFRRSVAEVCTGCHADTAAAHTGVVEAGDDGCVACHMPTRRTGDVVEVTMTDHRIARGPFDHDALVAPMERDYHSVTGIGIFDFGDPPGGSEADLYRSLAALRSNRYVEAAAGGLAKHLEEHSYSTPTPRLDLARAQLRLGDLAGAEATAGELIRDHPKIHTSHVLHGLALLGQGRTDAAIDALRQAVELQPDPETLFNLAAALLNRGDLDAAERSLNAALELRPFMAAGWKYRGLIRKARGERQAAIDALERSLALDPGDGSAYRELIVLLRDSGGEAEADRYLELYRRLEDGP